MNNDRELLQQALVALDKYGFAPLKNDNEWEDFKRVIEALYARLSQCERCGEANPAEIHTCTPNEFNPDWSVMAVMVEEQQRMAKRIAELEARLAQQEPVAIVTSDFDGGNKSIKFLNDVAYTKLLQKTLLYTAPPQREWQGLTDEDWIIGKRSADYIAGAEWADAKLKEKNSG